MTPHEAAAVLAAFQGADEYESLSWRVDMNDPGRDVKLLAGCSDFFHLATADAEEITASDIPMLTACLADLAETSEGYYLAELFAARKRKMRPCGAAVKGMSDAVKALFDACSTAEERAEVDRRDAAFWSHVAHQVRSKAAPAQAPRPRA